MAVEYDETIWLSERSIYQLWSWKSIYPAAAMAASAVESTCSNNLAQSPWTCCSLFRIWHNSSSNISMVHRMLHLMLLLQLPLPDSWIPWISCIICEDVRQNVIAFAVYVNEDCDQISKAVWKCQCKYVHSIPQWDSLIINICKYSCSDCTNHRNTWDCYMLFQAVWCLYTMLQWCVCTCDYVYNRFVLLRIMPPLHRATSELGVVPCGKEIWTRPHGSTRGKKRHTGTPRVS